MKNRYISAFVTSCLSVLPVVLIIYVLSLTNVTPIGYNPISQVGTGTNYLLLGIGAFIMIIGLMLFQIGADQSLTKVGEYMGSSLSKQANLWIIIIFAFLLGALITCAEPSILIVAEQAGMNPVLLIAVIAVGVGVFVVIGILRILWQKSLKMWFIAFYLIVFLFICILQVKPENHKYLPFIFDAGGITTGAATVPFILALGAGVSAVSGGKNSRDNSFGLVGLASIGPILSMTILILLNSNGFTPYVVNFNESGILDRFVGALIPNGEASLGTLLEVLISIAPIVIIFLIYQFIFIKLSKVKLRQLLIGFLISFFGLVFFLTAVNATMQPIGLDVGVALAKQPQWVTIIIAFVLGLVTILCEPAVHVLTVQIENISDGQLKKRTVLIALGIGVGVAIALSAIRTMFGFSIMYYIVPGYMISFILMFFVPDIFTAIAFDSGGTASGPMSVSFILPLLVGLFSVIGAKNPQSGDVVEVINGTEVLTSSTRFYENSFGVIALIALTPIIAIQILGFVGERKNTMALRLLRKQIADARNDEIIHFN